MMMPTQSRIKFMVVHTQTVFSFTDGCFYRPAQACHTDQFCEWGVKGCIAKIDLEFRLFTQRTTEDDPQVRSRQLVPNRDTYRVFTFLEKSRLINDIYAIVFARRLIRQLPMHLQQLFVLPSTLAGKLLHRLNVTTFQSHWMDRMVRVYKEIL